MDVTRAVWRKSSYSGSNGGTDRKINDLNWARGSGPGPGAVIGPGRGGMGQAALVMVTSKPRAWIWRIWLRIFRSVSVRAW